MTPLSPSDLARLAATPKPQHIPLAPKAAAKTPAEVPTTGAPRVTPVVTKTARNLDVPLAQVSGTGTGGRITVADVEAYATAREEQRVYDAIYNTHKES